MASAKESPRQKMIGMMYLVLTALLALNVSKDILDAFVVVNKGLEKTTVNFTDRNDELYSLFDLAKTVDPNRVTPNWKKAQEAKKGSEELVKYIDQLQKEIIIKTEGVEQSVADTIQMANLKGKDIYDAPTHILIGDSEDGSAGASRELKNKLIAYRTQLNGYVLPADKAKVKIDINTDDPTNSEENENWEMYNFYHRPLVASLTILSKLKNDVKNAEASAVDYLLRQVDDGMMKFDTVAAKVVPQSNYVLLGEEYKAELFVVAFNKTKNPEVTIEGNEGKIPVNRGVGNYVTGTSKEGIMKYNGNIKIVTPSGKEKIFPFQSEYIVAKPALNVAVTAMNVVYRGLPNPISVSVPGIPNEKLSVTASNAILVPKGNGNYEVKPTGDGVVKLNVSATMEDGTTRNMGTQELRIKQLPQPTAKFAGMTVSGPITKSKATTQLGVTCSYENFVYNVPVVVKTFKMTIINGSVAEDVDVSKNNMLTDKMKIRLQRLKRGEKIILEDMDALGADGKTVKLNDMILKVNG